MHNRPFTLDEAPSLGLNRSRLRSQEWRRVGPRTYVDARRRDDSMLRLEAAACRLPEIGAFCGFSAAWLRGIDVEPCDPMEAIVPKGHGVSARSGMIIRRASLPADEVSIVNGLRATTLLRTLEDLGRRLDFVEATVIVDMALYRGLTDLTTFTAWALSRRGGRGLVNLRKVAGAAEPKSQSPMETRLRLLLVAAGLPRPEAQVPIYDQHGNVIGKPDLYYAEPRLGIEYDGGVHRDQLVEDDRRQNRLLEVGVRLLRFTAADVLRRPYVVVAQVRGILHR